jgi:hypothetical protein
VSKASPPNHASRATTSRAYCDPAEAEFFQ